MAWLSDIDCRKCGYEQPRFLPLPWEAYVLPTGEVALLPFQVAWCGRCRAVVRAEHPADALRREADWQDARLAVFDPSEYVVRRRAECGVLRRVADGRTTPPRCLECGSTGIVGFGPWEWGAEVVHPGCGGALRFPRTAHCYPFFPTAYRAYSPEGVDLGREVVRDAWPAAPDAGR